MEEKKKKNKFGYNPVYCWATLTGDDVIHQLELCGGKNVWHYDGKPLWVDDKCQQTLYYLLPNGTIECLTNESQDEPKYQMIMALYSEVQPKAPRWRAGVYEEYYTVRMDSANCRVDVARLREEYKDFDDKNYKFGNYFATKEEAIECQKRIIDIFTQHVVEEVRKAKGK